MRMHEISLARLQALRRHVQQSLETIRANEPFYTADGQAKPERNDLLEVVNILGCKPASRYKPRTYMWAAGCALETTMEAFTGKEALPDLYHIKRYLSTVSNKTKGKYRFEQWANTLFFLGRFRNKLTNKIATERKTS